MDKSITYKFELEMIFFDVGLGDCSLAISYGKTLLIDGGSRCSDSLRFYLKEHKISKIDYLICTHAHEDHVDGLAELMEFVTFDKIYSNIDEFKKSKSFTKLKECIEREGKSIIIPSVGDSIIFGSCQVVFLSPGNNDLLKTGNNRSLTCMIICGGKKIFMTADIGDMVIKEWITTNIAIDADILKIPHHGLESLPTEFLDAVHPTAAVISYGKNNYGVLSDNLICKLMNRKIEILRTDKVGDICCQIQDDQIKIAPVLYKEKLKGKKLLILAANEESKKFVRQAQELGIYTIVTDYRKDSPAKAIADKSYDIDAKSVEEVVQMALEEKIDGIIVGVADPLVGAYIEIAERLDLPCYLSKENKDFFINKKFFKYICSSGGLPTVKEFYSGGDWNHIEQNSIEYPCIVKPIYGRGGKGVFLCKNKKELKQAFFTAQTYSDNGEIIIEAYMNYRDIIANYFFCNGIAYLIGVSDRKVLNGKSMISPVTYGNVYPSKLTETFIEQCHNKFLALFKKLNIYNGILEMQIFWDGKNFYPYDPACILGGELSSPIFSKVLGIDLITSFLTYSLTGSMNCFQVPSDGGIIPTGGCAESIWILLKPGIIGKVEGISGIEAIWGVLGYLQRLHEGDAVSNEMFQTEKSAIARIWIKADNFDRLEQMEKEIRSRIKVFDQDNRSMIWEGNEN